MQAMVIHKQGYGTLEAYLGAGVLEGRYRGRVQEKRAENVIPEAQSYEGVKGVKSKTKK